MNYFNMRMIKENFNKNLQFVPYGIDKSDWKNFKDTELSYISYVMPLGRKMIEKSRGGGFVLDIEDKARYYLYVVLSYAVYEPYENVAARTFIRLVSPTHLLISSELYSKEKYGSVETFIEGATEEVHIALAQDLLKGYTETQENYSSIYSFLVKQMVDQTQDVIDQYDAYYVAIDGSFYYSKNFSKIITTLGGHKESKDSQDVSNILKAIEGSEIKSWVSPKNIIFYRVKGKEYDSWVKNKKELEELF
jgi:hypothetical protein